MPNNLSNTSDHELLLEFNSRKSEEAFAELVRRYMPMVLSVCERILNQDHHSAQDAVQAVFLLLARKAGSLNRERALGGWLHHVAVCIARDELTSKIRRFNREQEASAMNPHPIQEITPG